MIYRNRGSIWGTPPSAEFHLKRLWDRSSLQTKDKEEEITDNHPTPTTHGDDTGVIIETAFAALDKIEYRTAGKNDTKTDEVRQAINALYKSVTRLVDKIGQLKNRQTVNLENDLHNKQTNREMQILNKPINVESWKDILRNFSTRTDLQLWMKTATTWQDHQSQERR